MSTFLPLLRETLYAGRVKFFAEESKHFTHVVFYVVIIRKTASSECILQWTKRMEVAGCSIGAVGRMRSNSPPHSYNCTLVLRPVCSLAFSCRGRSSFIFLFGQTLRILCFNVCPYLSEFTVASVTKNSTRKIPSLSQKSLP